MSTWHRTRAITARGQPPAASCCRRWGKSALRTQFCAYSARSVQVHVFKTSDWAFLGGFDEIERMNEMRELHARLHAAVSAKSKFDEMQRINDGSWPGLKNVTLKKSEPQRRAGGAANGVSAAANGDSGAAASRMAPVAELLGISRSVEGEPPTPDEIALGLRGNTPERRVPEPDRTVHDSVPADDATSEPEHRSPSGRSALVVPAAHSRTQPPKPELADPKHHAHIAGAVAPARHAAEAGAWSEAAAAPPASSASLMESRQRLQADAARHMLKMKLLKFYTQHAPDKLQYIDAYTNDYLHRQGALSLAACLSPSAASPSAASPRSMVYPHYDCSDLPLWMSSTLGSSNSTALTCCPRPRLRRVESCGVRRKTRSWTRGRRRSRAARRSRSI